MSTARDILMWNDKTFHVSADEVLTFKEFSSSSSYSTEQADNGSKMPKSKDKNPNIGSVKFTINLSAMQGNDCKAEYNWWRDECNKGTYSNLYLGMGQFGDYKWRLTKVDLNNLVTLKDGAWKSCSISVSFEEYWVKIKKTKLEKKAEKLAKKLAKQIKKAQNSKSKKAREQAALKAADLTRQLQATNKEIAEKKAAKYYAEKTKEESAAQNITTYYDDLNAGEDEKLLKKEINEGKKYSAEVKKMAKECERKNNPVNFFDIKEEFQADVKVQLAVDGYNVNPDGTVTKGEGRI